MLLAKIGVTIKLIMDKNGITQLWTVKCWGPTTGLLHNPKGCFQGGGCETARQSSWEGRTARGWTDGGKARVGIATPRQKSHILSVTV
jgi:hypothetical protein